MAKQSALESLLGSIKSARLPDKNYQNVQKWADTFGFSMPDRNNEVAPISAPAIKENKRMLKRQNYIRNGWTFDSMSPYETQIYNDRPPEPSKFIEKNTAVLPKNSQEFQTMATPIFDKYKIPYAVGMGMYAGEGRGQGLGASRNNFYNIGAWDSNPGNASTFETPEAGIEAYAKFISGQFDRYASPEHQQKFAEAYNLREDPVAYLKAIQNAGYAGDPNTYAERATNDYSSYADFIMATPEWKSNYQLLANSN